VFCTEGARAGEGVGGVLAGAVCPQAAAMRLRLRAEVVCRFYVSAAGFVRDSSADSFAGDCAEDVADFFVVEDHDIDIVFHAVVHGLSVHDLKILCEHIAEGDFGVADGVWVSEWISGVDAINFGGFEDDFGVNFTGAEGGGSIGGDEGAAGSGSEDDNAAFFEVSQAAAADERFGNTFHANGALESSLNASTFESILQCESVDDGSQHSHVVGRGRDDTLTDFGKLSAAENIATATNDSELNTALDDVADLVADRGEFGHSDPRLALAAEAFAAEFQEYSAVWKTTGWRGCRCWC